MLLCSFPNNLVLKHVLGTFVQYCELFGFPKLTETLNTFQCTKVFDMYELLAYIHYKCGKDFRTNSCLLRKHVK